MLDPVAAELDRAGTCPPEIIDGVAELGLLGREGKTFDASAEHAIRQPILDKYECEGSPYYSTARLWDDGILDPKETRPTLARALSIAFNAPMPPAKFGVFRM